MFGIKNPGKEKKAAGGWPILVLILILLTAGTMKLLELLRPDDLSEIEIETFENSVTPAKLFEAELQALSEQISTGSQQNIKESREVPDEDLILQSEITNKKSEEVTGSVRIFKAEKGFTYTIVFRQPRLVSGFFYEGWIVRPKPYQAISIGRAQLNEKGEYYLDFSSGLHYKEYTEVGISIEKDDGDPLPADEFFLQSSLQPE